MIYLEEFHKNREKALTSNAPIYKHVAMISKDKRTIIQVKPFNVLKRKKEGFVELIKQA